MEGSLEVEDIHEALEPYAAIGVLVFNDDGILVNTNAQVEADTGIDSQLLIGTNFFDVVISDEKLREKLCLRLRDAYSKNMDFAISIVNKKSEAIVRLNVTSVLQPGGSNLLVFLKNITAHYEYDRIQASILDRHIQLSLDLDMAMKTIQKQYKTFTRELEQARQIQQHLLPDDLPRVEGLGFAAIYEPTELVGGDLYDFVQLLDGRLGVFVADVSGHGVPASMIASMAKLVISLFGSSLSSPGKMLAALNELLYGKTATNFLTCCYAIISHDRRKLVYAHAGHPPFLHLRSSVASYHGVSGRPIGWFPEVYYEDREIALEAGDSLLIYSDGLTEAANQSGELFEDERMSEAVVATADQPLGLQLNAIVSLVRDFQGQGAFEDDITFVGIEIM